jgi:Nodulation protein Z (NodZ)
VLFYHQLRDRFRGQTVVNQFRRDHFDNKIVIGIHIRAGNGESGDFSDRNRTIADLPKWLQSLAALIRTTHLSSIRNGHKAVIFLATDTPSLESKLKVVLPEVDVVVWSQQRPSEGSGVLFGVQGRVNIAVESCLDNWEDAFIDMMLLSYVDVLIAARPSSFTQALPMSLILSHDKTFCEVNLDATAMQCYTTFQDWCCRGRSSFSLEGIKQRYEYVRMPTDRGIHAIDLDSYDDRKRFKIEERPPNGCEPKPIGWKQTCLPFDWSALVVTPR